MTTRRLTFAELPLFAGEHELAVALVGPERAGEWKAIVPLYEARGFPKIDPMMRGRYTRAVLAFFDHEYRLSGAIAAAPPGVERPIKWGRLIRLPHTGARYGH